MNGQWEGRGVAEPTGYQLFGLELRRLRLAQGTSQAALSRAVHYSNAYLCKVENGQKPPTLDLAKRCDDALGTDGALAALLTAEPRTPRRGRRRKAGDGPAQLPADIPGFTGRASQLARLKALRSDADGIAAIAITGAAGVGKTALAVHFGHLMTVHAPDGQLYLNMRGTALAGALRPAEALSQMLRGLGVPAEQVPAEADEAAAMYRSLLAGRQVLVVLDNAASSEQVRLLLPGSRGCTVIITSRDRLTGLAASHGVARMPLDLLPLNEAVALLARLLGQARVASDPDQAAELATMCSRLPLALRIAAAKLSEHPELAIADYVTALRSGDLLVALEVPGDEVAGVSAAFSLSYSALEPRARRMFRLLGPAPGQDISVRAAAALAEMTAQEAVVLLQVLEGAHLLDQHRPGRFAMHDLLREYSRKLARAEDGAAELTLARDRLYGFYLLSSDAASRLISPGSVRLLDMPLAEHESVGGGAAQAGALSCSAPEAIEWIDAERENLIDVARQAMTQGPHQVAWLLADATQGYFWLRRHGTDWLAMTEAGLAAAQAGGDERSRGCMLWRRADAQFCVGQYDQATAGYQEAAALADRAGWPDLRGAAFGNLGMLYRERGLFDRAADCYGESLTIAKTIGSTRSEAANLSNLGIVYMELGQLERSAAHLELGLTMHTQAGSKLRMARAMISLVLVYHQLGRWPQALTLVTDAIPLHREAGDAIGEANARNNLSALYSDLGRPDEARAEAETALSVARQAADRTLETDSLNRLGDACLSADRYHEGVALYRQAAALAAEISPYMHAEALIGLTLCAHGLGRIDEAAGHAERALTLTRKFGFAVLTGRALAAAARVRLDRGGAAEAAGLARDAHETGVSTGHLQGQELALRVLGHALTELGRTAEAARALTDAAAIRTSLDAHRGVAMGARTDRGIPGEPA